MAAASKNPYSALHNTSGLDLVFIPTKTGCYPGRFAYMQTQSYRETLWSYDSIIVLTRSPSMSPDSCYASSKTCSSLYIDISNWSAMESMVYNSIFSFGLVQCTLSYTLLSFSRSVVPRHERALVCQPYHLDVWDTWGISLTHISHLTSTWVVLLPSILE